MPRWVHGRWTWLQPVTAPAGVELGRREGEKELGSDGGDAGDGFAGGSGEKGNLALGGNAYSSN